MPTIEISKSDLEKQLGRKLSQQEIEELLPYAKCEYDSGENDLIKADCKDTNRPDLWCAEGIARQIKGALGKELGVPNYKVHSSDFLVRIDPQLKDIRPRTACAVVKGIKITEDVLNQIIQLQEKISGSFGRNRKEAAIGVYDFDKIKWPVHFSAFEPDKLKFTPLDMNVSLTLRQILHKHPKGQEFAHLLEGKKKYPVFIDSAKNVLSMPPIINSDYSGKVTAQTENLFIEVSGFDDKFVQPALNAVVAALADRGGQVYEVHLKYNLHEKIATPDFTPKKAELSAELFNKLSGLNLSRSQIAQILRKARLNATVSGSRILVEYPAYRQDIMHEVDLVETALIAYGYNNIEPEIPNLAVTGCENELEVFCRKIREFLIGFQAQEIMNFTLTNKSSLYYKMGLENGKCIEIANPVSQNWSVLRTWLIPSVVEFLSSNTTQEYPQKVFEVGDVVLPDSDAETGAKDVRKLAFAVTHQRATFTEIKQILQSLLDGLGLKFSVEETEHSSFIPGRAGAVKIAGKDAGIIGELHPQVLKNWKLENPVCIFEVDVEKLTN